MAVFFLKLFLTYLYVVLYHYITWLIFFLIFHFLLLISASFISTDSTLPFLYNDHHACDIYLLYLHFLILRNSKGFTLTKLLLLSFDYQSVVLFVHSGRRKLHSKKNKFGAVISSIGYVSWSPFPEYSGLIPEVRSSILILNQFKRVRL